MTSNRKCIAMLGRHSKLPVTSTVEGEAAFGSLCVHVPCLVLNHTARSACVLFPVGTVVPDSFSLCIGEEVTSSPVRVIWRSRRMTGVAFATPRSTLDVIAR